MPGKPHQAARPGLSPRHKLVQSLEMANSAERRKLKRLLCRTGTPSVPTVSSSAEPAGHKGGMLHFDLVISLILSLIPLGYSMSGLAPHIEIACVCFGAAVGLLTHAFWIWKCSPSAIVGLLEPEG
jgi:hypothetical protein